jgi:predicted transcriptional regulator
MRGRGATQPEIASYLGVSRALVRQYLSRPRPPDAEPVAAVEPEAPPTPRSRRDPDPPEEDQPLAELVARVLRDRMRDAEEARARGDGVGVARATSDCAKFAAIEARITPEAADPNVIHVTAADMAAAAVRGREALLAVSARERDRRAESKGAG